MRRTVRLVAAAAVGVVLLPGSATAAVEDPVVASVASIYPLNCNGAPQTGTLYPNSEVEPHVAVNPAQQGNVIAVWQQDRWSDGGAQGLPARVSFDGGETFEPSLSPPFSRCAGGNPANGGDYERASDPWVSISPDGTAYFMALAVSFTEGRNAMLVARSRDGGRSWGPITTLIADDGAEAFNDKNSLTADPTDSRYAYAVWDRLATDSQGNFLGGPTYLARTTNGGASWEPARPIYDPGPNAQTIANQIEVLPDGTLVNLMTVIFINPDSETETLSVGVIRSSDKGATWSEPIFIDGLGTVGVSDPRDGAPVRSGDIVPDIAVDPRRGTDDVYVVWQDARFTSGQADSVVLSRSTDAGQTWTPPTRVSAAESGQAFTPVAEVDSSGLLGVTYYDFTFDSPVDEPLRTDAWIVHSPDGGRSFETRQRLTPVPFDLRQAPEAGGFFVGDYTGLDAPDDGLQALYSITGDAAGDPTDVLAQRATASGGAAVAGPVAAGPPPAAQPGLQLTAPVTRN